mgnify:CR=1 FL=1
MALVASAVSKGRTLPSQLTQVPAFSWLAATGSTTSATSVTGLWRSPRETTNERVQAARRPPGPETASGATPPAPRQPAQLKAGYKANVVPARADAILDVRYLPGQGEETLAEISRIAGDGVRVESLHYDVALETTFEGNLVDAMVDALAAEDPDAAVLPYMLSAGTDNKSLSRLGIVGYGFVPLPLPPELDFTAMFHGVAERVPIESRPFGTRVRRPVAHRG